MRQTRQGQRKPIVLPTRLICFLLLPFHRFETPCACFFQSISPERGAQRSGQAAGELLLGIRPEDIRPDPAGLFTGEVALTEPLGETLVHIKIGEQPIVSTVPGISALRRVDNVKFGIVRERLHFFDGTTGLRFST